MDRDDDEQLMRGVAEGSHASFERLVERHLRRVVMTAQSVMGNAGDADEIAQEAFLRIWQHAGKWQASRALFTTWLYRIVVNLCIDRRRRRPSLPLGTAELAVPDPSDDPIQTIAQRERQAALLAALAALPPRQRLAVSLFHMQGLGAGEAARRMDISVPAFEQLLFRARRALRESIRKAYGE